MGFRDHGYYGYAFVGARPCQIVALVAVIGMVGNFISADSHAHIAAPGQLVGTLVMACLALLWSLLSFTAYDDSHIPYIATSATDVLFVIPFIVFAAVLGGPLSATTCSALPVLSKSNASAGFLALAVGSSGNDAENNTSTANYILLVGDNQTTCYAIMAVWGLLIALCVLFALSGLATGLLFLGQRRARAAALPGPTESAIELAPAASSKTGFDAESVHSTSGDEHGGYPGLLWRQNVDNTDEDDNNNDDDDDDDDEADGAPATPLSPPPSMHQTQSRLATHHAINAESPLSLMKGPGRQGTIKIVFSPHLPSSTAIATATATTLVVERKPIGPPPREKGESRFREARDSLWPTQGLQQLLHPGPRGDNFQAIPSPPLPPLSDGQPPKVRRKTIFERIDGWWDLGLLRGGTIRGHTSTTDHTAGFI
ncbi:hypothetical protein SPI_04436 [Niveomyces insectorum RCEF 264]|uniref:Uncharacterized protein n=1 Tax=Niveomyces insectorum RCEF 264 TaxID=1081102 RepID=A0A167VR15_9HYPO|nr:hypothetical protein SPI_04436 [Niveomyces insectorum RCEF 264]